MSARPDLPPRRERVLPWVLLTVPPVVWMAFEYGAGAALRPACAAVGSWLGPSWGVLSLLACIVTGVVAWPMARRGGGGDPPTRPWLARVALLGAGVFALAIAFQTIATLIVPSCVS